MQPRIDIIAFNEQTVFNELLAKAVDSAFSRIPVFRTTPDNMVGILYTKDLLVHSGKDNTFNWRILLHPPFFVPESKKNKRPAGRFPQKENAPCHSGR